MQENFGLIFRSLIFLGIALQTRAPGRGVKNRKCPKMVRRGCKRSFGPTAQRSPKSHLHRVQPCFAPVQPEVAPVQEAFRSLSSKDLLHPLLTIFGHFLFSTPLPGALVCKNCRHFSSQRRVCGVVNLGGVVETLRRSNSLSRSVLSTVGSFGLF